MSARHLAFARYLALLECHPWIHALYLEGHRSTAARSRFMAAVASTPVLAHARQAWIDAILDDFADEGRAAA